MNPSQPQYNDFQLTSEFVQHTSQNIFLTGKAGTGKTTFLKHIKETCRKNLVVVAPTGVAAINAGGVTAHSFFQLPLGLFYPGSFRGQFNSQSAITDRHHLVRNLRISNEKRDLINHLELVIIDEVSMLRCDMLDAIDVVLRFVRKNQREPFGGVQMLFIGDLYQLPPVTKDEEWQALREFYQSPFFFAAQVFAQAPPVCIELKKVYRQRDEQFIQLLNRLRNNEVGDLDLKKLNSLYKPGFRPDAKDHYITLTTHNYKADDINSGELKRLSGKEYLCTATVSGEFPERNFPVEKVLKLKAGAQVMFVRNDTEERKYFNGKIGVIREVSLDESDEFISVEFPETRQVIRVEKVTWQNMRYSFKEPENKIEEEQLGSFTQYPVRLAWAVTIHKSQGLTFPRAVIDAGAAFAAGQVYVALSRCVSMEGIVLLSAIRPNVIMTDPAIVSFMEHQDTIEVLLPVLAREKEAYTIRKTMTLFNLQPLFEKIQQFMLYMGERQLEDKEKMISGFHAINDSLVKLKEVSEKFRQQVDQITSAGLSDQVQALLNDRVTKAKEYFEKELDDKVNTPLLRLNKELQQMRKVRKALREVKFLMTFCENFTAQYSPDPDKRRERFNSQSKPAGYHRNISSEMSDDLFNILKGIRRQFAEEENVAPYMICHDSTLSELSRFLPLTLNDMAMIKGMGDERLSQYGDTFLSVIQKFCSVNGLASRISEREEELRAPRRNKRNMKTGIEGDSKTQSLRLFQSGKSIIEIAEIRGMTTGTIEGHLAHFIKEGELDVFKFVSKEKFELIKETILRVNASGYGAVKNLLGDSASYSEIRMVFNALNPKPATRDTSGGIPAVSSS